jgi:DNA gyrase subunit A
VGTDGSVRALPDSGAKRDASGTPLDGVVGSIGSAIR